MPQTLYPRSTVKKIIKAHSNRGISKNADVLVFLAYALFVQDVVKEAGIAGKRLGERGVSARGVRRVREGCLRKFKG